MIFKIQCLTCPCSIWVNGVDEPDVNAVSLDENDPAWTDEETCQHLKDGWAYEITDSDYDDDEPDWGSPEFEP